MKKLYLFLLAGALGCFVAACSNDDSQPQGSDYAPGEIPGLGSQEGDLTGTPFALPDGVELTAQIMGGGNQYGYWNFDDTWSMSYVFADKAGTVVTRSFTTTTRTEERHFFGSGYGYVDLVIPMRNTRTSPLTVTFPAALILRNVAGDSQNGVLLKKVTVTLPASADYYLSLAFYCGNAHKGSAGSGDQYVLGVVSDAKPLLELCDKVKNRKINIEEFDPTSRTDYSTYQEIKSELQSIVWEITDGQGLSAENLAYLNTLPISR